MKPTEQFPGLDEFLAALRFEGIPIGPHELVWLHHAFKLAPSLDRQGLKHLLACTLIKQDSHREVFESWFADWCPPDETNTPEPANGKSPQETEEGKENAASPSEMFRRSTPQNDTPPSPDKPGQRIARRIFSTIPASRHPWAITLLVIFLATIVYRFWPVEAPPVEVKPPPTQPEVISSPPDPTHPSDPVQQFWTWTPTKVTVSAPAFIDSIWATSSLAFLSVLTGAFLWWRYKRREKLPEAEAPPGPGPIWVPLRSSGKIAPELVNRDALRTAVWGIERFVSDEETARVNVERTVAATATAGGLPTVRHEHAVYPREVWLWRDVMAQHPTVDRVVNELDSSLTRAGLPIRVGTFAETPNLIRWREGQEFSPLVMEGHRQHALVMILTDGYGMDLAAQSALEKTSLAQMLKAFGEWPRLTFVDVGNGAYGLAKQVQRYGLRCIAPEEIPAFLAAGSVSAFASHRTEPELYGDLRAWAAATALAPGPVTDSSAFALRERLGLDLSPWEFRDLLTHSKGTGERLAWSPARKVELLHWLSQCSTKDGQISKGSLLAQALDYWIEQYQKENQRRRTYANALLPWKQTAAEQRLRMEIGLLELWRQPETAIEELYRLYTHLTEEIQERLALFAAIALPWQESGLSPRVRVMLARMGFGGRPEQETAALHMPVKLQLVLGLCAGLAVAAGGTACWRLLQPGVPILRPELSVAFQPAAMQHLQRANLEAYRLILGSPKALHTEAEPIPARSVVDIDWQWKLQDNVEKVGQSELWRAGTLPQAIRGCEGQWPQRSLVVIQAEPTTILARQLAIQLLDRGSADLVLLGTDWAAHLDELRQIDTSLTKDDQLVLILPSGASVPKVDFQGAFATVPFTDLLNLTTSLKFSGVKLLTEVWPDAKTEGQVWLRGGPLEKTDEQTGITFVTVCGGTFTMGSDKEVDKDSFDNESPRHSVTLSTFEISKTETTNAQYRGFQKDHEGEDSLPAANVSWDDAKAFCENYGYALPTEAEWEYAARSGSTTRWSFGEEENLLSDYTWNDGRTHPVGTKLSNPLGLFDMHGNVWEWVEDCYDASAYKNQSPLLTDPLRNPGVGGSCQYRTLRGGSAWGVPG